MACILNLETSTTNCSVALSNNGKLIALKQDNSKQLSHAERLHTYIDLVLNQAQIERSEIDAVAVSKGPGSYTGLRIGVSAAKGLCFGLDLPLISVPTLQLLAYKVNVSKGRIISAIDARRMEVYSAVFDAHYKVVEATSAKILDANSYAGILQNHQVYFVGNAMDKIKTVITHPNAHFDHQLPSAAEMCGLSHQKYEVKDFEDLAYFEPFYLKDFITIPTVKN